MNIELPLLKEPVGAGDVAKAAIERGVGISTDLIQRLPFAPQVKEQMIAAIENRVQQKDCNCKKRQQSMNRVQFSPVKRHA